MTQRQIFDVAYQPQVRTKRDVSHIMLDVIISLVPAVIYAAFYFGPHILITILVSVCSAVFFEWAYRKLLKKSSSIWDLSAVVTGLMFAMTCPPSMPYWMPVIGTFFGIVVVKQLYGGIGKNILNPALAGRAFMVASYTNIMGSVVIDGVTQATPLTVMYSGERVTQSIGELFIGLRPGAIGEVSAVLLLLGGIYLIARGVITWHVPVSFVGTVAVISLIGGHAGYNNFEWMMYNILSGGVILNAFFMATDYCTTPVTNRGRAIYGIGCGAITMLIRYFGGYPEGVTYGILIMNLVSWALDKAGMKIRYPFGTVKAKKEAK